MTGFGNYYATGIQWDPGSGKQISLFDLNHYHDFNDRVTVEAEVMSTVSCKLYNLDIFERAYM